MGEGLGFVWVRYLGDKEMLLIGKEGVQLVEIINTNKDILYKEFEVIRPWGEGKLVGNRIVWMRCMGIPISLWMRDCFRKVVNTVGNVVEVDEATLAWEQLEYARIKVRTTISIKVEMYVDIMINNTLCQLFVLEETPNSRCDYYRDWCRSDSASYSSSSMDTRVNESLQMEGDRWVDGENFFRGGDNTST